MSPSETDDESTNHLNIMNKTYKDLLWRVTFSYARAIQQSVLKVWLGEDANLAASQQVLSERAKLCSESSVGML